MNNIPKRVAFKTLFIFCLDLLVCIFALSFAYFLKYNFNTSEIDVNEFSRNILIFSILNSVVFFSVKTYAGIIRYTSAQDSIRILFSILISNGLFFLVNLILISCFIIVKNISSISSIKDIVKVLFSY